MGFFRPPIRGSVCREESMDYFPAPESQGGWRVLGGADPDVLAEAWEYNLQSRGMSTTFYPPDQRIDRSTTSAVLLIRHGYVVGEWYQNADRSTRWNVRSCSKSFTGTAFGMLFDEGKGLDIDSPAYDFIPEGYPLSDPRKAQITLRHLLSMTSSIPGEGHGIFGLAAADDSGPFEFALGKCPNEGGQWVSELTGAPGTTFEYSDMAFAHLAIVFRHVAGEELDEYLRRRLLDPIGVERLEWTRIGGGSNIGPHTLPGSGVRTTARDFARFGYLLLRGGEWAGRQLVPRRWIEEATRSSQEIDDRHGYTWWVNTNLSMWKTAPRDAFAAMGFAGNKCYVVPSLDLVVVRIADGPMSWDDAPFVKKIIRALG